MLAPIGGAEGECFTSHDRCGVDLVVSAAQLEVQMWRGVLDARASDVADEIASLDRLAVSHGEIVEVKVARFEVMLVADEDEEPPDPHP